MRLINHELSDLSVYLVVKVVIWFFPYELGSIYTYSPRRNFPTVM